MWFHTYERYVPPCEHRDSCVCVCFMTCTRESSSSACRTSAARRQRDATASGLSRSACARKAKVLSRCFVVCSFDVWRSTHSQRHTRVRTLSLAQSTLANNTKFYDFHATRGEVIQMTNMDVCMLDCVFVDARRAGLCARCSRGVLAI